MQLISYIRIIFKLSFEITHKKILQGGGTWLNLLTNTLKNKDDGSSNRKIWEMLLLMSSNKALKVAMAVILFFQIT